MTWPQDKIKLDRVQGLMAEEDLDALVVRAPDNVLYLTNFWGMKGYDAAVFPREGPPVLITIEPSAEDAADTAWTTAVVLVLFGIDTARNAPQTFAAMIGLVVLAVVLDLVWKRIRARRHETPSAAMVGQ